jgi:AcrR family transcriptional regulator
MRVRRGTYPRSDASREKILEAAADLFSHKGYAGAGVDELAARSGIAKTAIYYHFGNKQGLLAAVLERAANAWIEGIQAAAREAADPLGRLDHALAGMRQLLEEKPWIFKLLQILALEVADEQPGVRATLRSIVARAREAIEVGMRDALGFALPGAPLVASVVLALLDGVALGMQLEPDMVSLDEAFEEIRRITMFMVGCRLDPAVLRLLEGETGPLAASRARRAAREGD